MCWEEENPGHLGGLWKVQAATCLLQLEVELGHPCGSLRGQHCVPPRWGAGREPALPSSAPSLSQEGGCGVLTQLQLQHPAWCWSHPAHRHHNLVPPPAQLDGPRSAPALTQPKSSCKGRTVTSGVVAMLGCTWGIDRDLRYMQSGTVQGWLGGLGMALALQKWVLQVDSMMGFSACAYMLF